MRGRIGSLALLVLLALAGRALWLESLRYQVRTVPAAQIPPSISPGAVVVMSRTPVGQLAVGDVIDFRHPSSPGDPLFLRVGSVERAPGSSGYLVRLDSGDPSRDPWHAELLGVAWRVVFSRDGAAVSRDVAAAKALGGAVAAATTLGMAWRWYRHRPRAIARTYRTDIW